MVLADRTAPTGPGSAVPGPHRLTGTFLLTAALTAAAARGETTGSVAGRVMLADRAPTLPLLALTEPACRAAHPRGLRDESVLTGPEGGLASVFVWVKAGLPPRTWGPPRTPARLVQADCRFEPRVVGLMVGQDLEIVNADPVVHNVHAHAKRGRAFNAAMPPRRAPWAITRRFTAPEVMVRIGCDLHGWMRAWAGVLPHPFFAVSAPDGRFVIDRLPPGRYRLAAWHERYGTRETDVTVAADGRAGVGFRFGGGP